MIMRFLGHGIGHTQSSADGAVRIDTGDTDGLGVVGAEEDEEEEEDVEMGGGDFESLSNDEPGNGDDVPSEDESDESMSESPDDSDDDFGFDDL